MILDFQYLEFGFGHPLTVTDLQKVMSIALYNLNMFIQMHKIPSWDILTNNPSPWGETLSNKSLNMVQVPRYIGPMTVWSYNVRNAPTSLRLFITVLISYFYLIIPAVMIE